MAHHGPSRAGLVGMWPRRSAAGAQASARPPVRAEEAALKVNGGQRRAPARQGNDSDEGRRIWHGAARIRPFRWLGAPRGAMAAAAPAAGRKRERDVREEEQKEGKEKKGRQGRPGGGPEAGRRGEACRWWSSMAGGRGCSQASSCSWENRER